MHYDDNEKGVIFSSVKPPLTLFNEGPLGIKYSKTGSELLKGMEYNGNKVTNVVPFINAVDIDWNGAVVPNNNGLSLHDTSDLLNWIKNNLNLSSVFKKMNEDISKTPTFNAILTYNRSTLKWEFIPNSITLLTLKMGEILEGLREDLEVFDNTESDDSDSGSDDSDSGEIILNIYNYRINKEAVTKFYPDIDIRINPEDTLTLFGKDLLGIWTIQDESTVIAYGEVISTNKVVFKLPSGVSGEDYDICVNGENTGIRIDILDV